ncbi:MAG TPA: T9SS type A sorting domain-containing protein [Bacteroidia bacterium]|nr:T9SS type A sorting domain-containing protein [Bacteroidia bacterium]
MKTNLTILCLLLWSAATFAAKGIIKFPISGGGNAGLILISNNEGYGGTDADAGELISFTELNNFPVGTAVTFDILPGAHPDDPPSGTHVLLAIDVVGTLITANQSGALTITASQAYTVTNGAQLSGNITLNGGTLYVTGGGSVNGNLNINGAGSVIVCDEGASVSGSNFSVGGSGANTVLKIINSTVNGRFSSSGIAKIKLVSNAHNGNVSSNGDGNVTITGNTISGNLSVSGAVSCNVSGNTVTGTTNTPGCTGRFGFEAGSNGGMEIFPNPAGNQLAVRNLQLATGVIEIYDALGKKVYDKQLTTDNEQLTIDITHLTNGIYFIRHIAGDSVSGARLTVSK